LPDEPTPGELQRNVADLRADVRERDAAMGKRMDALGRDLSQDVRERDAALGKRMDAQGADLSQRLDRKVTQDLFNAHLEADRREKEELRQDNTELRAQLQRAQERSSTDRRLVLMALFTAVLAPLFFLLLNTFLRAKGAAP
jgi:septal ring factor EnvC (AmiA/AmiB activator)